jgi:DDE superfamily endonuclease
VLRDAYIQRIAKYRADQLVFLDESGINTNMGERTHGWGLKGKKIINKVNPGRSPNISLLPAMTINGYLACSILQGSVNREAFLEFIEAELIPRCNPYPGSKSVIIMDNASIHHCEVHY